MSELWEQRSDEPAAAYARFLIFRNLGPGRSIARAVKVVKGDKRRNGQWERDSHDFEWGDRATAWDIEQLTNSGQRTVLAFINALEVASVSLAGTLADRKFKPKSWDEAIRAINTLGSFIPAETVAALRALADSGDTPPIGAGDSGKADVG